MSQDLKKLVKRTIIDYKTYFKSEDVTSYARGRFGRTAKTLTPEQVRKMLTMINARLNQVFDNLDSKARQTALDTLGGDEALMRRFVRQDRFALTFSQKFQMSRKRIRKLIAKRVQEAYIKSKKEATSKELLDLAQETWETTAEFSKFIAYVVADAWNFRELNNVISDSQTGMFEIRLSDNHEHSDICNLYAGIYENDDDVDLPPYHPYCVCIVVAVTDPSSRPTKKTKPTRKVKTVFERRDEEARKLKKLEQEYEDWYGIKFDLEGMDYKIAKETLEQFDSLAAEYPNTAARLTYIGTYQNPTKKPYYGGFQNGTIAHATADGRTIAFNPQFFGDAEEFKATKDRLRNTNWSVQDGSFGTSVTHEFGHQLDNYAQSLPDEIPVADYTMESGVGEYWHIRALHYETYKNAPSDYSLSEYATKPSRWNFKYPYAEARAESIAAAWHRAENDRTEFDKAVEKFLTASDEWTPEWTERSDYEYFEDAEDKEAARQSIVDTYAQFGLEIFIDSENRVYVKRNGKIYLTTEGGEHDRLVYSEKHGSYGASLTDELKKLFKAKLD